MDDESIKLPVICNPLSILPNEFTTNPSLGSTDAVTEPLAILNPSSDSADSGILNNPSPLPLNEDAESGNSNVENVFTTNPSFGEIDAVAEPLLILFNSNAKADSGISNKSLPLPKNDDVTVLAVTLPLIKTEPVNICLSSASSPNTFEPDENITVDSMNVTFNSVAVIVPPTLKSFSISKSPSNEPDVLTTNPKFGETDAVTEPDAILNESSVSAVLGMFLNWEPSPANEPEKDAVTSLAIIISAFISSTSISSDTTNEPVIFAPPNIVVNVFTSKPLFGEIDAVAEPLAILLISNAKADSGISNNPTPLPLKIAPGANWTNPPLKNNEPVNREPLSDDTTLNPYAGSTDAVTEPLAIWLIVNDKADSGILNNPSPLPLKYPLPDGIVTFPPLTKSEPLNCAPVFTLNPKSGATSATTDPLTILLVSNDGTFVNREPSPTNEPENEPLNSRALIASLAVIEPVTFNPPAIEVYVFISNPLFGEIDAVAEPLAIRGASPVSAESGISNNPAPLPE